MIGPLHTNTIHFPYFCGIMTQEQIKRMRDKVTVLRRFL